MKNKKRHAASCLFEKYLLIIKCKMCFHALNNTLSLSLSKAFLATIFTFGSVSVKASFFTYSSQFLACIAAADSHAVALTIGDLSRKRDIRAVPESYVGIMPRAIAAVQVHFRLGIHNYISLANTVFITAPQNTLTRDTAPGFLYAYRKDIPEIIPMNPS